MGESNSRWGGMALPRRYWSTYHLLEPEHKLGKHSGFSPGLCGQGQPAGEAAESLSLDQTFYLQTWFLSPPPPPSLQPQRETDTNQITSQIDVKLQLVHGGEVDGAGRTCNLRFPQEAEVWPAQCGRSRCIEGTWENISQVRRASTQSEA